MICYDPNIDVPKQAELETASDAGDDDDGGGGGKQMFISCQY